MWGFVLSLFFPLFSSFLFFSFLFLFFFVFWGAYSFGFFLGGGPWPPLAPPPLDPPLYMSTISQVVDSDRGTSDGDRLLPSWSVHAGNCVAWIQCDICSNDVLHIDKAWYTATDLMYRLCNYRICNRRSIWMWNWKIRNILFYVQPKLFDIC